MTIHWCGTGLSAVPGLRRLIAAGYPVTVWNRTVKKAQDAERAEASKKLQQESFVVEITQREIEEGAKNKKVVH